MGLASYTVNSIAWVGKVNAVFLKIRPLTTLALIVFTSTQRFVQVLATFLPLKVLLLAGSDGIPAYFQFFIQPHLKNQWILALALGAVVFYVLSLLLERWIRWLSALGSREVLQGANEIAVTRQLQSEASGYFAKFGGIVADAAVVVIALSLLAIINVYLVAVLLVAFSLQYAIAMVAIRPGDVFASARLGLKHILQYKLSGYLTTCASLNFLLSFFILLYPFVLGQGGNLLFSILAILLLRQTFSALSSVVNTTAGLWKKKFQIDPLVFRNKQLIRPEHRTKKSLRSLFDKEARERMAAKYLDGVLAGKAPNVEITSEWQDSSLNKVTTFLICAKPYDGAKPYGGDAGEAQAGGEGRWQRCYQHQVVPKKLVSLFEHEDFLFEHIDRESVRAPRVHAAFSEGNFVCRLYEYGLGRPFPHTEWKDRAMEVVVGCWSIEPPRSLVDSYLTSHPTLPGRMTHEFLSRAVIAVDDARERDICERFLMRRQELVERLARLPLFIYNPDLNRMNVIETEDGHLIVGWGRWKLEPVGVGMPSSVDPSSLEAHVDGLVERRGMKGQGEALSGLLLASRCHDLEKAIEREQYKEALQHMSEILASEAASARAALV